MAYEASEIMTAHALRHTTAELKKITTYNDLTGLIDESIKFHNKNKALNAGQIQFATEQVRDGFGKKLLWEDIENEKKRIARVTDMAQGISAALAIRGFMRNYSGKITTYMTGNKWPTDVERFQVKAFGFTDYNSADIVVKPWHNHFYGISLKKKKTVAAQNPTLINKAFDTAFHLKQADNKDLFDKFQVLKEELVNARTNYFAGIVRDAVEIGNGTKSKPEPIILKKDIKGVNWSRTIKPKNLGDTPTADMLELFESKKKDLTQFEKKRAYIDTKGWASADKGYFEDKTTDSNSMRYYVNKRLAERPNDLWDAFIDIIDQGAEVLGAHLINIILKTKLFEELDYKEIKENDFNFALVTGIGNISAKYDVTISSGKVIPLKTTLCGLDRIENKLGKNIPYKVEQDIEATNKSDAAKIFFKLTRGGFHIMDLEVRYKGSFTPQPQFQANMAKDFKKELDKECSGGPG